MPTPGPAPLRRLLTACAVAVMLGVAGCGGSQVEYQEVPGAPAEITLPESEPSPDATAEDDTATDDEAAADEAATPDDPAATATPEADTGTTATEDPSTTQAEAPTAAEDGPANDEPPVPGTDAERFEDFCEQNAGAC